MGRFHSRLAAERERCVQRQHAGVDAFAEALDLTVYFQVLAARRQQDIPLCLGKKRRRFLCVGNAERIFCLLRCFTQQTQILRPRLRAGACNALGDRCRVGVRRVDHQIKFRVGEHLNDPVHRDTPRAHRHVVGVR